MNREILFKAKRADNREWVEGSFVKAEKLNGNGYEYFIIEVPATEGSYPIDENTLCQFTGLYDKNGNKIWENDIVFVTDDEGNSGMVDTGIGEIDFLEGLWYISGYIQNSLYDINKCFQIEVKGNIFDNADLLEKEQEIVKQ